MIKNYRDPSSCSIPLAGSGSGLGRSFRLHKLEAQAMSRTKQLTRPVMIT
jgi:hypothetical protein